MTNESDELAESRDVTYHGKNHGKDGRDKVLHPLLGGLHKGVDLAHAPVLGDVIVAQGSPPDWERYGLVVPAAGLRNGFFVDNGETVPTWQALLDSVTPATVTPGGAGSAGTQLLAARRDHDHPATDVASAATLAALVTVVNDFIALEYANGVASAGQQLTSNSTVFQNITGMILPLTANALWRFSMTIISLSTVAADFKFQFTVPAGAVLFFSTGGFTTGGVYTSQASIAASTPISLDGLTFNVATEVFGTVVNGANAGNLQLQAAQNTATIENTDFVVGGSNIFGRRIG